MDGMNLTESLFRWIHVVSGILWIGLLYFFNFVNGPFAATMDADTKKKVVPGSWKGEAPRTAHRLRADEAPDFAQEDPPAEDGGAEGDAPSEPSPQDDAVDQVQNYIYDRAVNRIRERMDESDVRDTVPGAPDDNDNLSRLARRRRVAAIALDPQRRSTHRAGNPFECRTRHPADDCRRTRPGREYVLPRDHDCQRVSRCSKTEG